MSSDIMRPWDMEAQDLCNETSMSIADARNKVISRWLEMGDTRPFYDWVLLGHAPSREVVNFLAAMIAKADSPGMLAAFSPTLDDAVSFGLSVSGKRQGDRSNPEKRTRDYYIGREVAKLIAAGEKYDVAIEVVHKWLQDIGWHLGKQTVRDAYDKNRIKPSR